MFKFEFFVEDKHLVPVMYALASRAVGLNVVPVINAKMKGSKMVAKGSGILWRDFIATLETGQTYSIASARAFLRSINASESSAAYLMKSAVKAGVLVRVNPNARPVDALYKLAKGSKR